MVHYFSVFPILVDCVQWQAALYCHYNMSREDPAPQNPIVSHLAVAAGATRFTATITAVHGHVSVGHLNLFGGSGYNWKSETSFYMTAFPHIRAPPTWNPSPCF